ncbi:MAG: Nramp family divalent metal transporter [Candidatus Latescibacteria bacterium]|nr:Nramp family divalent metal transporter [Candidatus Latescibacterota bacterium]
MTVNPAPRGIAVLAVIGPAFVWCAEYIGSGEVILATRMGAILGYTALWAPVFGIILKTFIGMGGAHYTVCTGEGMIDMFGRMPGKGNWVVWIVLVGQFCAGAISIGGVASAAGIFAHSIIPLKPFIWGWIITLFAIAVVWSGKFDIIKYIMSMFVFIIICGVLYIAVRTFPGAGEIAHGIFALEIPDVPEWALALDNVSPNPWNEILPLIGWAAGGFASQVWYTYWIMGAGYGMAQGRSYGQPCDTGILRNMSEQTARNVKGWCRVVYVDAMVAMIIGVSVTCGFMLAGSGVLRPLEIAPEGPTVAFELSTVFSSLWGKGGSLLFMLAGCTALTSTLIGQFAGWPRLIADSFRICIPKFNQTFAWKTQFRLFILLFFITNVFIVFSLGIKPVFILKIGAVFEGLLLTPFQAVALMIGLLWVLPRLLSKAAWNILKPSWILIFGLAVAAVVFGYFCMFMLGA